MELFTFRMFLMIILCIGTITQFSQRICLSMAVVCMTNHTAVSILTGESENGRVINRTNMSTCSLLANQTNKKLIQMKDGPFIWNSQTRGRILGSFFWGYLFGQIPTSLLLRRFGARRIMLFNLIAFGVATMLIPIALMHSVYLLYVLRVISGFVSASWLPGFYQIWASWAPPDERGVLIGISFAGMQIGNAIALSMTGVFCQTSIGWPLVFYFYGACSIIYCVVWILFVYDSPTENPRISEKEKKYLIAACGKVKTKGVSLTSIPALQMLKSLPLWAFLLFVVGYDWNSYTFLTVIPTYMKDVLAFDINENAGLSALPFIGLLIGQVISGWLTDWILARKLLSLKFVRKCATGIGMLGPGMVLVLISFFDCQYKYFVVAIFTFGLLLNSGVFSGGFLNPIELSPKHSGIILAIANTMSAAAGGVAPLVVGFITPHNSYDEWKIVFYIGAAIYVITGIFFICCSSNSIQPWAIDVDDIFSSGDLGIPVSPLSKDRTFSLDSTAAWQKHNESDELLIKTANI